MIALSLALALEVASASAPAPPPSPTWPAGVVVKARAELPLVVAALSLPLDPAPALLPLVASWLAQPESWPEGPVARLYAVGGRVDAEAHPDGLVVLARGPAERQADVVAAALALLSDLAPSGGGFEPARAAALAARSASRRDDDARVRRALWRAWYGGAAASARAGADEAALLRATEADARAVLDEVKRASAGHRLFLEGAARPGALPLVVGALRPASAPLGPPSLPRPADASEGGIAAAPAAAAAAAPALVALAHPLPEGPWSSQVGLAFTLALERRLAPLGDARASVEAARHARLLVVTLRPPDGGAGSAPEQARAEALDAVRAALADARQGALLDRALRADLEQASAALAKADRRVGGWAERQARGHLAIPFVDEADSSPAADLDALVGLLRISVLPEVLRAAPPLPPAPVPPAPPSARAAPSAASGGGRG